ncbi:MAG TPA: efflux RND transporter permease subunit [Planctomycetota bacterium]
MSESALELFFRRLVTRPVAVLMLSLALIGTGLIAGLRIPIEMIPKGFSDSSVSITAPWPGANPLEIEQHVVRPLEEELRTIRGVNRLYGVAMDGQAVVVLGFPGTYDMDQAYAEVADRVERVRPRLPAEVDRLFLRRATTEDTPVMWLGVNYDATQRDEAQEIFADVLQPRIEQIDGVASVRINGLEPRSVRILLDEERVRANRVDVGALLRRLQADNVSVPVGDLDEAGARFIVRVDGRFDDLAEIESFPVDRNLRIKDIGRVVMARSVPDDLFRVNGGEALGVSITKETSANTFEVCARILKVIEEEFPADPVLGRFAYSVFWNEGDTVRESLASLVRDATIGGLIACAVLFLFLRRVRFTLLIAVSIPFSVLVTLAWLYFAGDSFNMFSMMGITISIGMLVDNSVVIVESIAQRRRDGESLDDACVRGPADMVLPVVTATLTTVVVFLPLIFLSADRNARIFTTSIGIPLCVALMAALLLSIVIVPVAARHLSKGSEHPRGSRFAAWMGRIPLIGLFGSGMPRLARWAVEHRLAALLLAAAFVASILVAGSGNSFQPGQLSGFGGQTEVSFDFAANTTLDDAQAEVLRMEAVILGPMLEKLGSPDVGVSFSDRSGELYLWHKTDPHPDRVEAMIKRLQEELPKRSAVHYKFGGEFQRQNEKDERWLRLALTGPDTLEVGRLAELVRTAANARPEDFERVAEEEDPAREIRVSLDRERMQRVGSNSTAVLGMIEWSLRGLMVSRFETERGDVPIIMEFDEAADPDRSVLEELAVASFADGRQLPLNAMATFEHARGPASIFRRDGLTMEVVGLKPLSKDMKRNAAALRSLMTEIDLPEGYRWSETGGFTDFQADMSELKGAFMLAIVLVFLLMGLLFESLVLPFSVLVTILFAVVGAMWTFKLADQPIDLIGMIGMIVLAGVVVNNGIVLVDRILRLQAVGVPRNDAIERAVADRLRPVVMTALTTICGLLPIALAEPTGNGISFRSLAIGVSGGLAFTTFFTLWVVPLFYSLLQDLGMMLRREVFDRLLGRVGALAGAPSSPPRSGTPL